MNRSSTSVRGLARASALLALVMPALAAPVSASADVIRFPIVQDGRPVVKVVAGGDPKPLAAALKDLSTYVERITGAKLDVTNGTDDLPGPTLHIGETALFAGTAEARKPIKGDGFILAKVGDDLLIAGNSPAGTANGILTVLQDQFGVRWYFTGPLWEIVPHESSLAIRVTANTGPSAYIESPSFYGRSTWGSPPSAEFGRRMRLTPRGTPLPYVGTGHALNHVVPLDKYAAEHPDYFALIGGRRVTDHETHPCFTHPDMFDVFMKYVREGGSSFGVNDNCDICRCERCLAVDGKSEPYMGIPNVSESFCQLMARVAAQTAKEFPGRRLGMFAYQITNAPPKTVDKIGDNVDVVLCQDTAQQFDPAVREMDQRMTAEWVRKVGGVSFYDYIGINYWTPRYFPHVLADQLRYLARTGVLGVGTHNSTMSESSMPMFYLYYQMLWNAELDPDVLLDTMIKDLYAEAADLMRQFYEHWESCWNRQKKGIWFNGMDNVRAELAIYSRADIERGKELLDAAAAAATDDVVRRRVDYCRRSYAYTLAVAHAHYAYEDAVVASASTPDEALALSAAVATGWRNYVDALEDNNKLPNGVGEGWYPKTFRVRAWGLKQEMRDGVVAPLVRWSVAHEGKIPPGELRSAERRFAAAAKESMKTVESLLTDKIGAEVRPPRADGVLAADVPLLPRPIAPTASSQPWPRVPPVNAVPWYVRDREPAKPPGKYDEPAKNFIDMPDPAELSMTWQAAWDKTKLYLRIAVRDDKHVQNQPPDQMWRLDSIQVALNPDRAHFAMPGRASWDFLMGGYMGPEAEFGVSLHNWRTETYVWKVPSTLTGVDPASCVVAAAARHGDVTVYDVAVDWRLLPDFAPRPERSLGICVVVNDVDDGPRLSAEYGSGVSARKRSSEFAAIRLSETKAD